MQEPARGWFSGSFVCCDALPLFPSVKRRLGEIAARATEVGPFRAACPQTPCEDGIHPHLYRCGPLPYFDSIVLGERLCGFAVGTREAENRQELEQFLASERVHQLVIVAATAAQYAGVYRELRRRGRLMPTNDMWIAASALQHGFVVCSIVWPQFLALAAIGGTFFGIAYARFRNTIGTMA